MRHLFVLADIERAEHRGLGRAVALAMVHGVDQHRHAHHVGQKNEFLPDRRALLTRAGEEVDRVFPLLKGKIGLAHIIVKRFDELLQQEFRPRIWRVLKALDDGSGQIGFTELGHGRGSCEVACKHNEPYTNGWFRVSALCWNTPAFPLSRTFLRFGDRLMLAPTPALPESVGMSKTGLDRIEAHLKSRYIDSGRFPGTQLMVYRRGKVVHSTSQGFADLERKVPVKDDTIYRIYSMTKPITSVAFMMLFEEGKVALDEPVAKYIPEWKNLGVFAAGTAPNFLTRPPTRPMLIVDLLRHTSGLTYGFQQRSNVDAAYREAKIGEVEKAGTLDSMIEGSRKNSAGIFAGRGLELFRFDRRSRLSHRQDFGPAVRAVP